MTTFSLIIILEIVAIENVEYCYKCCIRIRLVVSEKSADKRKYFT